MNTDQTAHGQGCSLVWVRIVFNIGLDKRNKQIKMKMTICLFVLILLRSSQQFFSHVGTSLAGLNQYEAEDIFSCSRTKHSNYNEV